MPATSAATLLDLLLASALGSTDGAAGNRFSLEGVTVGAGKDGAFELRIRKASAAALRVASGPLVLELGQLALHDLSAVVRIEDGRPRWGDLQAASAECSGLKVHGPLAFPGGGSAGDAAAASWRLDPLAAIDGTIRAQIVDAHLLFDADVTVPVRQGRITFSDTSVEHVGPDSRMGVSRLGVYVDAPNGRSYLYQFPSTPVAGVEYEKRGALLGPWVTDRGSLQLQPFVESLLHQPPAGHALQFTEQARQLFDRTSVSGELQLGDGTLAAPGVQAEVAGRAERRNAVRIHSEAVGRGVTIALPSFLGRSATLDAAGVQLRCDEASGALVLRLLVEGKQVRFAFEIASMKATGLRLQRPAA